MRVEWKNVIDTLKQRFYSLSMSDQRAVLAMCVIIVVAIVYLTLSFSASYQKTALARYSVALQDERWMTANQTIISNLALAKKKAAAQTGEAAGTSLINRATTSAKPFGIAFKRFQPQDENGLRLWIEGAEFDMLMRWLAALDQQQIKLDQLEVGRQDKQPGIAEARVLISSGQ